jgi:hypothetical protein
MSHPPVIIHGMCEICDGKSIEQVRTERRDRIDAYGYTLSYVESTPPWGYTIGLVEHDDHPELVVAGLGPGDTSVVLHPLAQAIQLGYALEPGDVSCFEGLDLEVREVHPAQLTLGLCATWLDHYATYGPKDLTLKALQIVMPNDLFCDHHQDRQPRLDLARPVPGITTPARRHRRSRRAS